MMNLQLIGVQNLEVMHGNMYKNLMNIIFILFDVTQADLNWENEK